MTQALKPIAVIGAIVFLATIALLGGLSMFGFGSFSVVLVARDGLILALLVSLPVYWLVVQPLQSSSAGRGGNGGRLAITDPLTRIMNRRGVTISLLEAMAYAERYDNALSIALIDIDHFDEINNEHGTEVGDKVLVEVAAVIAEEVRMPDKFGRYGGEEFLLILPATTVDDATAICKRIASSVADMKVQTEEQARCTVCAGVCQFRRGEDLEQLMSRIDDIVAKAKDQGRNTVLSD